MDLGLFKVGQTAVLAFRPEADATTGPCATRTAGPLVGGGATDPCQFPAVDAPFGIVSDASEPDRYRSPS